MFKVFGSNHARHLLAVACMAQPQHNIHGLSRGRSGSSVDNLETQHQPIQLDESHPREPFLLAEVTRDGNHGDDPEKSTDAGSSTDPKPKRAQNAKKAGLRDVSKITFSSTWPNTPYVI